MLHHRPRWAKRKFMSKGNIPQTPLAARVLATQRPYQQPPRRATRSRRHALPRLLRHRVTTAAHAGAPRAPAAVGAAALALRALALGTQAARDTLRLRPHRPRTPPPAAGLTERPELVIRVRRCQRFSRHGEGVVFILMRNLFVVRAHEKIIPAYPTT